MSKPSRLARPSSAGAASKLPSARKEDFGSRSKTISSGEKLLRTGSEGTLVKKQPKQQVQMAPVSMHRRAVHKGRISNRALGLGTCVPQNCTTQCRCGLYCTCAGIATNCCSTEITLNGGTVFVFRLLSSSSVNLFQIDQAP